jgi:hypothetical protein
MPVCCYCKQKNQSVYTGFVSLNPIAGVCGFLFNLQIPVLPQGLQKSFTTKRKTITCLNVPGDHSAFLVLSVAFLNTIITRNISTYSCAELYPKHKGKVHYVIYCLLILSSAIVYSRSRKPE